LEKRFFVAFLRFPNHGPRSIGSGVMQTEGEERKKTLVRPSRRRLGWLKFFPLRRAPVGLQLGVYHFRAQSKRQGVIVREVRTVLTEF